MLDYYESNSNGCLGKNLANSLGLLLVTMSHNVIHWSCHQNCPLSVFFQFFTFVAFLAAAALLAACFFTAAAFLSSCAKASHVSLQNNFLRHLGWRLLQRLMGFGFLQKEQTTSTSPAFSPWLSSISPRTSFLTPSPFLSASSE